MVVVLCMQNYHLWQISVKRVVDSTKWENAPDLDFAISCTWNLYLVIWEGKLYFSTNLFLVFFFFHICLIQCLFIYLTDICIQDVKCQLGDLEGIEVVLDHVNVDLVDDLVLEIVETKTRGVLVLVDTKNNKSQNNILL